MDLRTTFSKLKELKAKFELNENNLLFDEVVKVFEEWNSDRDTIETLINLRQRINIEIDNLENSHQENQVQQLRLGLRIAWYIAFDEMLAIVISSSDTVVKQLAYQHSPGTYPISNFDKCPNAVNCLFTSLENKVVYYR